MTSRRRHQLPTSSLRIGSDLVDRRRQSEILESTFTPNSACDAMHVHKTGQPLRRFTPAAHYPTISSDVRVPYTCGRSRLVTAPQRQRCAVWLTCTVQPSVLNAAARSIAGLRCSDHITDNTLASLKFPLVEGPGTCSVQAGDNRLSFTTWLQIWFMQITLFV